MIILGLLLILGTAGLSLVVIQANDDVLAAPAGAVDLFGTQINMTVGQLLLAGAAAGALTLLGLFMVFGGLRRHTRRRSEGRHQLRDHREEMQELQRKHDATSAELATHRTADEKAADYDRTAADRDRTAADKAADRTAADRDRTADDRAADRDGIRARR